MCGRYALRSSLPEIARIFGMETSVSAPSNDPPRYNIAPTQSVPVFRVDKLGACLAQSMRWGLIPSWTKEPNSRYLMINARAESLRDKPSFRVPYQRQRCLIPADGYYEWRKSESGKTPYFFRKRNQEPFCFAGLWESWRNNERQLIESCTIVTTQAATALAAIHHRSPVILKPTNFSQWLDPALTDTTELDSLLLPCDQEEIEYFQVSNLVNNVRNDSAQCIEPDR